MSRPYRPGALGAIGRPRPPRRVLIAIDVVGAIGIAPVSRLHAGLVNGWPALVDAVVLGALIAGANWQPVQIGLKHRMNVATPLAAFTGIIAARAAAVRAGRR